MRTASEPGDKHSNTGVGQSIPQIFDFVCFTFQPIICYLGYPCPNVNNIHQPGTIIVSTARVWLDDILVTSSLGV